LGKAGAVSYMFRVIQMCGKKHITHLKLALDILSLLCKSKSNAARLISLGESLCFDAGSEVGFC
jgi:hypothetical protein